MTENVFLFDGKDNSMVEGASTKINSCVSRMKRINKKTKYQKKKKKKRQIYSTISCHLDLSKTKTSSAR